jgi:hypothetical protein
MGRTERGVEITPPPRTPGGNPYLNGTAGTLNRTTVGGRADHRLRLGTPGRSLWSLQVHDLTGTDA